MRTDRQTHRHTDRQTDRQIKLDCVAKTSLSVESNDCRLAANITESNGAVRLSSYSQKDKFIKKGLQIESNGNKKK